MVLGLSVVSASAQHGGQINGGPIMSTSSPTTGGKINGGPIISTSSPTTYAPTAPTPATTWRCLKQVVVESQLFDKDQSKTVSVGDCLAIPSSLKDQLGGIGSSFVGALPKGLLEFDPTLRGAAANYLVADCGLMIQAFLRQEVAAGPTQQTSPPYWFNCSAGTAAMNVRGASVAAPTPSRTDGIPIDSCDHWGPGYERSGELCYPRCRDGYSGSGPLCLTNCPSGYRDDGLYCFKPESYGRGVGTPMDIKTTCSYYKGTKVVKSCKTTSTCGSKEECLGLCYNSCRSGYYAAGCNVCSPRCPSGMTDIGVSCEKGSYGRGAGKPLTCRSGMEYDAGLCYWPCPSSKPHSVGKWCFKTAAESAGLIAGLVVGSIVSAAAVVVTVGAAAPELMEAWSAAIASVAVETTATAETAASLAPAMGGHFLVLEGGDEVLVLVTTGSAIF